MKENYGTQQIREVFLVNGRVWHADADELQGQGLILDESRRFFYFDYVQLFLDVCLTAGDQPCVVQ